MGEGTSSGGNSGYVEIDEPVGVQVNELALGFYEMSKYRIVIGETSPRDEIRHFRNMTKNFGFMVKDRRPAVKAACCQARAMIQRDVRRGKV